MLRVAVGRSAGGAGRRSTQLPACQRGSGLPFAL